MENGGHNIKQIIFKYICNTCALQEIGPAKVVIHFSMDTYTKTEERLTDLAMIYSASHSDAGLSSSQTSNK